TGAATPESVSPIIIDVDYNGPTPNGSSPYMAKENWRVKWSLAPDSSAKAVQVDAVSIYEAGAKILLHVSGNVPADADVRGVYWTVLFNPSDSVPLLPQLASSIPNRRNQANPSKTDCENKNPNQQPY